MKSIIITLAILASAVPSLSLADHGPARSLRGLRDRKPVRSLFQARPVRGRLGSCGARGCG